MISNIYDILLTIRTVMSYIVMINLKLKIYHDIRMAEYDISNDIMCNITNDITIYLLLISAYFDYNVIS